MKLKECKAQHFSIWVLHSKRYKRRSATKKVVAGEVNRKKGVDWWKERKSQTVNEYSRKVIFSDESHTVLGANNLVYIWRKDDEKEQSTPYLSSY